MATNFPGSVDSLTNPSAGNTLDSPSHSLQHTNANDAIESIESFLLNSYNPSFRNLIINGAMQVAQRGTSVASISSGFDYRTADRWNFYVSSLGTWTNSVENDAPTGSGFRKSFKNLCTTADASPSASDECFTSYKFEGQNLQSILKGTSSAKQLTLSFWVKSNVTGTYITELYDADNTRSVSASYSISASGTWEKKTITFPADTTGAFDNDNALSLYLNFWHGAGSSLTSGTLQTTWGAVTTANRAVGQTNLAAATNNYWQITGVQLEVGEADTPYEFKPIDVELAQCQRYYYKHVSGNSIMIAVGSYFSATQVDCYVSFPVTMRDVPVLNIATGTDYYACNRTGGADLVNSFTYDLGSTTGGRLYNNTEASGTNGVACTVYTNNASSSIAFSAEL